MSMMHFLAGMIEEQKDKRYANVHGFIDDLKHVPKASRGENASNLLFLKGRNVCRMRPAC